MEERRKVFNVSSSFVRKCPVKIKTFAFNKKEYTNVSTFIIAISKAIRLFIEHNNDYFSAFDEIVLYYDNGQKEICTILHDTFETQLKYKIRMEVVEQKKYKLLQVADYACTIERVNNDWDNHNLSKSDVI